MTTTGALLLNSSEILLLKEFDVMKLYKLLVCSQYVVRKFWYFILLTKFSATNKFCNWCTVRNIQ